MAQTDKQAPYRWKFLWPFSGAERFGFIFFALCALVALAPLPLGSARPLAWDTVGLWTGALLLASIASSDTAFATLPKGLAGPLLLFIAVVCIVVVQILPEIPVSGRNGVWDLASETLGHPVHGTIAADPEAARVYLFRLFSYAGIFYLTVSLCRDRERAHAALKFASVLGALYGAYALTVYWSGNTTILWVRKWAYGGDLTGTFVNRNNFATFLGLCTLASLGYFVVALQRLRLTGNRRMQIAAAVEFVSARVWLLFTWLVLAAALLLTHSRGGFIATAFGVLVFVLATSLAPSLRDRTRAMLIAVPLILGTIGFIINGGVTLERMMDTGPPPPQEGTANAGLPVERAGDRLAVDEITLAAVADHPIFGTGLGSFVSVFPIYRAGNIAGYFDLAHDDYVQNLLELGIPGAACLFLVIGWLAALCVRGAWTRRRDAAMPCLGIAATALVGLHATVDFSLQIPAVTALYLFLLGIAVAQSHSSRTEIGR